MGPGESGKLEQVGRKKLAASDYILKIPVREIRECTSALKCSKSGDFAASCFIRLGT
jgi:hypothetical protein